MSYAPEWYAVHAVVRVFRNGPDGGISHQQIPTFYLNSRVQGILSDEHACEVARDVLDPLGAFGNDLAVNAYAV